MLLKSLLNRSPEFKNGPGDWDHSVTCEVDFKEPDLEGTKQADGDEKNMVEGFASVFGNLDQQDDIMHEGAFAKTIQERVPVGKVKFLDTHQWSIRDTLGTVVAAREVEGRGLWFRAKLSSVPSAQEARAKMMEGHIDRVSIGFDIIQQSWEERDGTKIRHIKEVKLYEISPVPIAANEETEILDVKTVVSFQDLPLASRSREWSREQAIQRLRGWSGGPDKEDMDFSKFQRAFLWFDEENRENIGAYKLPIGDVVDGSLRAVPRGVFAAAAAVEGARGGVDVPSNDMGRIRSHLEKYYRKMRGAFDDPDLVAPWNQSAHPHLRTRNLVKGLVYSLPPEEREMLLKGFQVAGDGAALLGEELEQEAQKVASELGIDAGVDAGIDAGITGTPDGKPAPKDVQTELEQKRQSLRGEFLNSRF